MSDQQSSVSLGAATKPLSSIRSYKPEFALQDIVAGIVIAALSVPIAMGYADIAGLPPEYGLYASIIAPLIFALVTGTNHIVFGMDSAASAMTGSMLATVGVALGTGLTIQVMPLLTLFVAAFLILFSILKAGRIIRLLPMPVMHGFIAGISVTVILTQIPLLLGTTADTSGAFWEDVINVFASIPSANIPSAILAVASIAIIIALKTFAPRIPRALVALLAATIVTAAFGLSDMGVVTLNAINAGLPDPVIPSFSAFSVIRIAVAALAIAVVVALESLLCLETFSIKAGKRSNGSRELLSFGIANIACSFFACPPCSASISRTAAGMSAGGRTQVASMSSAVAVAAVVLFCGPILHLMPRATLSAIVTIALIEVCDFGKIARYAKHMKSEFLVFFVAFVVVILFGAVPGILAGFAIAIVMVYWRKRSGEKQELLGAVPFGKYDNPSTEKKVDPGLIYIVLKLEGNLNFLNIDSEIDRLANQIDGNIEAVILKVSKITGLDTTATDKIIQFLDMLYSRGIYVKLVRKVNPTNDSYTRFELRQIMHSTKFYPNVRFALASLKSDNENGIAPQRAVGWLNDPDAASPNEGDAPKADRADSHLLIFEGDNPVLTVIKWEDTPEKSKPHRTLHARLTYLQSQEKLLVDARFNPNKKIKANKPVFNRLQITSERTGQTLAQYNGKSWDWIADEKQLELAISITNAYLKRALQQA